MRISFIFSILLILVVIELSGQQGYDQYPYWRTDQPTWYCPQNYWNEKDRCQPGDPRGWNCWEPPWYPYDEIHRNLDIGKVIGRSMMIGPYRYINMFLGVPFAKPPVGELRFKNTEPPGAGWDQNINEWDASCFRPACPQEIWELQEHFYETKNMSEDCLYMNIYSPNITSYTPEQNKNYPVLVFIHGEYFNFGDSQLYPGHILAQREIIVVTFNYRLGALGFLSLQDQRLPGNYGMFDQRQALQFVKRYISIFRGDPNSVTIAGYGSGAASVGLHIVSPGSKYLFDQAIAMSGSDLCEWAVSGRTWSPKEYAYALGRKVGCDPELMDDERLYDCFRRKSPEDLVNATATVFRRWGSMAGPFSPVVDGNFLPDDPRHLRQRGQFAHVRYMSGLSRDSGAYIALNQTKGVKGLNLGKGMDPAIFRQMVRMFVEERFIRNVDEVAGAIEFQYTYWANRMNRTAARQEYFDLWSDYVHGWCVDEALKYHANDTAYSYLFHYRSEYEPLEDWMGVPYNRDCDYVFGFPFFNETLGNITGLIPEQDSWTYMDKNISFFMQEMWANFTKFGTPTTQYVRNVTWWPYSAQNLSFLYINEWSFMDINYRQNFYAFWRQYFPDVSSRYPLTTTPQPTPRPMLNFQIATFSLVGIALIILFILIAMGMTYRKRGKQDDALL